MIWNHTKLLEILDTSIACLDKRKQMTRKKILAYLFYQIPSIHHKHELSFAIILYYLKYLIKALTVQIRETNNDKGKILNNRIWNHTKLLEILDKSIDFVDKRKRMVTKENT